MAKTTQMLTSHDKRPLKPYEAAFMMTIHDSTDKIDYFIEVNPKTTPLLTQNSL